MVSYTTSQGDKQYDKTEVFTSGLGSFPEAGGLLDQPHRLMSFFEAFLNGDRRTFGK